MLNLDIENIKIVSIIIKKDKMKIEKKLELIYQVKDDGFSVNKDSPFQKKMSGMPETHEIDQGFFLRKVFVTHCGKARPDYLY